MAFFEIPVVKDTVVIIGNRPGRILTNVSGTPQALLPKAHGAYDNQFMADGTPIIGYDESCPAIVELCVADFCKPCEVICVIVPDAVANADDGTVIYGEPYAEPATPADAIGVDIPELALAGSVPVGTLKKYDCGSPSSWDQNKYTGEVLPAGYQRAMIEVFLSQSVELKAI